MGGCPSVATYSTIPQTFNYMDRINNDGLIQRIEFQDKKWEELKLEKELLYEKSQNPELSKEECLGLIVRYIELSLESTTILKQICLKGKKLMSSNG